MAASRTIEMLSGFWPEYALYSEEDLSSFCVQVTGLGIHSFHYIYIPNTIKTTRKKFKKTDPFIPSFL